MPRLTLAVLLTVLTAIVVTSAGTITAAGNITAVATDNKFDTAQITVNANEQTTVTLQNRGTAIHNWHVMGVQGQDGKEIETKLTPGGQSASVTFTITRPGTYTFQCDVHPNDMKGTLTVQGAPAAAAPAPSQGAGTVTFRDDQGRGDQARVEVTGLPVRDGTQIQAWLQAGADGEVIRLGQLKPDAAGKATLQYNDPQRRNLPALFDRAFITAETTADPAKPHGEELLSAVLPPGMLSPLRQLLARYDDSPKNTALAIGLLTETATGADHANLAQKAVQANDLAGARLHLEHIVNIIEGPRGPHYGDLDGDGAVGDPGDGFGVLGYAAPAIQEAQQATGAGGPAAAHGPSVVSAAGNVTRLATEVRDTALPLFATRDVAALRAPVDRIVALMTAALNGQDGNGDGRIDPTAGEGGARTAYDEAQAMASLTLTAPVTAGAAAPAPGAGPQAAAGRGAVRTGGTRLVVIAVTVTAVFLAVLCAGAWVATGRRRTSTG
jgi:plastocyanin